MWDYIRDALGIICKCSVSFQAILYIRSLCRIFTPYFYYVRVLVGTYLIARRHGHVFRMALHNEGDWRMETWQRARQDELSCLHTPIPELCNAILNTCQMPSRFYIIPSNVNKSQTHLLKPLLARDLLWWRAIYAGKTHWSLLRCFVLNCVHAPPHVLSPPSCCEKSDSWRQARSVKTAKKVMNGTTMWSCDTELCTNGAEVTKCWVFIAHFSIYSTSWCRCHAGTDIPRHRGHTLQINQVVRTVRHRISHRRKYKIGKSSPQQPCENTCHSNHLELSLLWMARALACF